MFFKWFKKKPTYDRTHDKFVNGERRKNRAKQLHKDGVSVRDIAVELGVTKGRVYQYLGGIDAQRSS